MLGVYAIILLPPPLSSLNGGGGGSGAYIVSLGNNGPENSITKADL